MRPLRIGVNALYLIPGGVGGTEIYLRGLLRALGDLDPVNHYTVFTNRETGADLFPPRKNFHIARQWVRGSSRPARIVWEQTALPLAVLRRKVDVLLNGGFTAPLACACPQVTVFHDLQHKRHPEIFPLVRSAALELLPVLVGSRLAPGSRRFSGHGGGSGALLPAVKR